MRKGNMDWTPHPIASTPQWISAIAVAQDEPMSNAVASAEMLLIEPAQYGVPDDVDPVLVFRFSRVKARPQGQGGGSVALWWALKETDRRGLWTVLEASPYPGQDFDALCAFYEKHGFQHGPERGLMFRPPA